MTEVARYRTALRRSIRVRTRAAVTRGLDKAAMVTLLVPPAL